MESLVNNVAESYFNICNEHKRGSGQGSIFVQYKRIGDPLTVSTAELTFRLVVGFILYRREGSMSCYSSSELLVKYFETFESFSSLLLGYEPFSQELYFFRTVLPIFDRLEPTAHLFVEICTSSTAATPTSNRSAIMYVWPQKAVSFEMVSTKPLIVSWCSLMLQKIAQFHSRSLRLQTAHPHLFEQLNVANPEPAQFNVQPVRLMLLWCVRKLQQYPQYVTSPPFRQGVSRFTTMIYDFGSLLKVPFWRSSTGSHCWVMCHQNFGLQSVIFQRERRGIPFDVKIFNCQTMGFASLAVDLVVPLFVELAAPNRPNNVRKLVRSYHAELQKLGPGFTVPSQECILAEMKKSVPFALYVLANRILLSNSMSRSENSLFKPNLWTENSLVDLCKYLINSKFI